MKACVNGETHDFPDGLTLAALLDRLDISGRDIAIAKNDRVVRRSDLPNEAVRDGDRIEIIKAVAGG